MSICHVLLTFYIQNYSLHLIKKVLDLLFTLPVVMSNLYFCSIMWHCMPIVTQTYSCCFLL